MRPQISGALRPAVPPLAVLVAAALAVWIGPALPPSLAGLKEAGAYFALAVAAGMALWFNRGRAFVAAASLLLAYAGVHVAQEFGLDSFAAKWDARFPSISLSGVAAGGAELPPEVHQVAQECRPGSGYHGSGRG